MLSKNRKKIVFLTIAVLLISSLLLLKKTKSNSHDHPLFSKLKKPSKTARLNKDEEELTKNKELAPEKEKTSEIKNCWKAFIKNVDSKKLTSQSLSRRLKKDNELSDFLSVSWNLEEFDPEVVNPTSKLGLLYKALFYSGDLFYDKEDFTTQSILKSKKLLKNLIIKDPQNSYPLYFLAMVQLKAGEMSKARKTLLKASRITSYRSYLNDFTTNLFLATVDNKEDYLAGVTLFSKMPLPRTLTFQKFNSLSPNATEDLGKKMVQRASELRGTGGDILWNYLDHQIGLSLLRVTNSPEYSRTLNYQEYIDINGGMEVVKGHSIEDCQEAEELELINKKEKILDALR